MAYDDWAIDGVTPSWIVDVDYNKAERQFVIHCFADHNRLDGADPRTEIAVFEAMACDTVTNTQLINGGSSLQICGGEYVEVTDGVNTWLGAVESVTYTPDMRSKKDIEYSITVAIETAGESSGVPFVVTGAADDEEEPVTDPDDIPDADDLVSKTYTSNYCYLSNIVKHTYTDLDDSHGFCNVIGQMTITETRNVKQVILNGACEYLPAWIEVNGQRQNWSTNYGLITPISYGIIANLEYQPSNSGNETLTFNLSPPSKIIVLQTSQNIWDEYPNNDANNHHGALLKWIKVVYE